MKNVFAQVGLILVTVFFGLWVFAQDLPVPIPETSNTDFIELLLKSIGGMKGAKTLAIVALVLQLLFKLLGTPLFGSIWTKLAPNVKFIVVSILSIASLVIAQIQVGLTPAAAILHGTVVTALMNYAFTYYERFVEKKAK